MERRQGNTKMEFCQLKVVDGEDVRRLRLPAPPTYLELVRKLGFGVSRLRYEDDDGDMVTVSSDQELRLALSLAPTQGTILKIYVDRKDAKLVKMPQLVREESKLTSTSEQSTETIHVNASVTLSPMLKSTPRKEDSLKDGTHEPANDKKPVEIKDQKPFEHGPAENQCQTQDRNTSQVVPSENPKNSENPEKTSAAKQALVAILDGKTLREILEQKDEKDVDHEHVPMPEENLEKVLVDFLKQPELSKLLASHMLAILNLLAHGDVDAVLNIVRNAVANNDVLAAHPFPQMIEPHYEHLKNIITAHMNSNWNTFLTIASTCMGKIPTKGVEQKVASQEKPKNAVKPEVNEQWHEVKHRKERDELEHETVHFKNPRRQEPEVKTPKESSKHVEEGGTQNDNSIEAEKNDSNAVGGRKPPFSADKLLKLTGKGDFIKWSFTEEGIPFIKFFKQGWGKPHPVHIGDRLVQINDVPVVGMTKFKVQETWLQQRGGDKNSSLYFLTNDVVHPFERHREKLKMLHDMGFINTQTNRNLLNLHDGDCEKTINAIIRRQK